jgi:hypothetical protein
VRIRNKARIACSALIITAGWADVPAGAQSLALSYDLEVRRDTVERVALPAYQCSGSDWLNSIASCASDGEVAAPSSPQETAAASVLRSRRVTVGGARHEAPAAIPHQTFQAGEDVSDSRRRTADVSLRFGSKNRLLSPEETRDVPRFVDAPYESYVQSNGHKAIGLELLVPFQ